MGLHKDRNGGPCVEQKPAKTVWDPARGTHTHTHTDREPGSPKGPRAQSSISFVSTISPCFAAVVVDGRVGAV